MRTFIKILIIVAGFLLIVCINGLVKGDGVLMPILAIPYLIFAGYVWKWKPKPDSTDIQLRKEDDSLPQEEDNNLKEKP